MSKRQTSRPRIRRQAVSWALRIYEAPPRIVGEADRCGEQASRLPTGENETSFLRKARQAGSAVHINDWVNSWGPAGARVRPPQPASSLIEVDAPLIG